MTTKPFPSVVNHRLLLKMVPQIVSIPSATHNQ